MRVIVDRGSAYVHAYLRWGERLEVFLGLRQRVVDLKSHCEATVADSRGIPNGLGKACRPRESRASGLSPDPGQVGTRTPLHSRVVPKITREILRDWMFVNKA